MIGTAAMAKSTAILPLSERPNLESNPFVNELIVMTMALPRLKSEQTLADALKA
jgi:hypothetical protein